MILFDATRQHNRFCGRQAAVNFHTQVYLPAHGLAIAPHGVDGVFHLVHVRLEEGLAGVFIEKRRQMADSGKTLGLGVDTALD